jgi:hypothetical protein
MLLDVASNDVQYIQHRPDIVGRIGESNRTEAAHNDQQDRDSKKHGQGLYPNQLWRLKTEQLVFGWMIKQIM